MTIANWIRHQSTDTGAGNLTLTPVVGFAQFANKFGTGSANQFRYSIRHIGTDEREFGIGYMSDATTLVRVSVIESTNSDNLVDFSGGQKEIVCSAGAEDIIIKPSNLTRGDILYFDGSNVTKLDIGTEGQVLNVLNDSGELIPQWDYTVESDIIDLDKYSQSQVDTLLAGKSDTGHTHSAADIVSGTFADARIAQSNVTQHEGALTVAQSQVTGLVAALNTKAEDFLDLSDTPSSFSGQNYKTVRVNSGGSGVEFTEDSRPNTDQSGSVGQNTARYERVSARFGQFVGTSDNAGAISTATTTRTAAGSPTGLMAGNQVRQGSGAATHYMYSGNSFKAVACIGNVYASGSGNALLSNGGGGSSVFGSAFTYGAGNAEVKSTNFGNFTAVYAYASGANHIWTNNAPGGFLAGYSRGIGGTVTVTAYGAGSFTNVRPESGGSTGQNVTVTNNGAGGFIAGHVVRTSSGTSSMYITNAAGGGFIQGKVNNGTMQAGAIGALVQGYTQNATMIGSGRGSTATGWAFNNNITASGDGSMAIGASTAGAITATNTNSFQFGTGTNTTANSLQVGTGIRLQNSAGTRNGDIWLANNYVYIRSNGTTCKVVNATL
jgi:hypothetical protein